MQWVGKSANRLSYPLLISLKSQLIFVRLFESLDLSRDLTQLVLAVRYDGRGTEDSDRCGDQLRKLRRASV
jgi:hypothetical protein